MLKEYTDNNELKLRKEMIKINNKEESESFKNSIFNPFLYQDYTSVNSKILFSLIYFGLIDYSSFDDYNLRNYMNDYSRINKAYYESLVYLKSKFF